MAITTFVRKEKKYLITSEQRDKLLKILPFYMNYDKHCQNGDMYTVNNIYFDTNTYDVIRYSLSKPVYKSKLRIRSYVTGAQDYDEVFLEMKKKISGIVNKRRIVGNLIDIENYILTRTRPKNLTIQQNQVLNEIDYLLDNNDIKPRVYLTYKRIALFGKNDSSLRVTIDEDLLARDYDLSLRNDRYGQALLPDGYYLMEIKISGAFPLWLVHILTEMNIYPTSFSKYGKFHLKNVKESLSDV